MRVRQATADDMGALARIYFRGVRIGAAPAYDDAQRAAWAKAEPSARDWAVRLDGLLTLVAEEADEITGFMSLRTSDGYLDFAFVDPDVRGTGVANEIYAELEQQARALGLTRLHTKASHMAKRFFEKTGWIVERPNTVTYHGVTLDNWIMSKVLTATA